MPDVQPFDSTIRDKDPTLLFASDPPSPSDTHPNLCTQLGFWHTANLIFNGFFWNRISFALLKCFILFEKKRSKDDKNQALTYVHSIVMENGQYPWNRKCNTHNSIPCLLAKTVKYLNFWIVLVFKFLKGKLGLKLHVWAKKSLFRIMMNFGRGERVFY